MSVTGESARALLALSRTVDLRELVLVIAFKIVSAFVARQPHVIYHLTRASGSGGMALDAELQHLSSGRGVRSAC